MKHARGSEGMIPNFLDNNKWWEIILIHFRNSFRISAPMKPTPEDDGVFSGGYDNAQLYLYESH